MPKNLGEYSLLPPQVQRAIRMRIQAKMNGKPALCGAEKGGNQMSRERLPIETAPRDGSIVKMQKRDFAPFHAFWRNGEWVPIEYQHGLPATHWLKDGK